MFEWIFRKYEKSHFSGFFLCEMILNCFLNKFQNFMLQKRLARSFDKLMKVARWASSRVFQVTPFPVAVSIFIFFFIKQSGNSEDLKFACLIHKQRASDQKPLKNHPSVPHQMTKFKATRREWIISFSQRWFEICYYIY